MFSRGEAMTELLGQRQSFTSSASRHHASRSGTHIPLMQAATLWLSLCSALQCACLVQGAARLNCGTDVLPELHRANGSLEFSLTNDLGRLELGQGRVDDLRALLEGAGAQELYQVAARTPTVGPPSVLHAISSTANLRLSTSFGNAFVGRASTKHVRISTCSPLGTFYGKPCQWTVPIQCEQAGTKGTTNASAAAEQPAIDCYPVWLERDASSLPTSLPTSGHSVSNTTAHEANAAWSAAYGINPQQMWDTHGLFVNPVSALPNKDATLKLVEAGRQPGDAQAYVFIVPARLTCPADALFALLPRASQNIGAGSVDCTSAAATVSAVTWLSDDGCGLNIHEAFALDSLQGKQRVATEVQVKRRSSDVRGSGYTWRRIAGLETVDSDRDPTLGSGYTQVYSMLSTVAGCAYTCTITFPRVAYGWCDELCYQAVNSLYEYGGNTRGQNITVSQCTTFAAGRAVTPLASDDVVLPQPALQLPDLLSVANFACQAAITGLNTLSAPLEPMNPLRRPLSGLSDDPASFLPWPSLVVPSVAPTALGSSSELLCNITQLQPLAPFDNATGPPVPSESQWNQRTTDGVYTGAACKQQAAQIAEQRSSGTFASQASATFVLEDLLAQLSQQDEHSFNSDPQVAAVKTQWAQALQNVVSSLILSAITAGLGVFISKMDVIGQAIDSGIGGANSCGSWCSEKCCCCHCGQGCCTTWPRYLGSVNPHTVKWIAALAIAALVGVNTVGPVLFIVSLLQQSGEVSLVTVQTSIASAGPAQYYVESVQEQVQTIYAWPGWVLLGVLAAVVGAILGKFFYDVAKTDWGHRQAWAKTMQCPTCGGSESGTKVYLDSESQNSHSVAVEMPHVQVMTVK